MTNLLRLSLHKSLLWNPRLVKWNNMVLRFSHDEPTPSYPRNPGWINRHAIGNREVVGHGRNGIAAYGDNVLCPFPAIRYKVFDSDLLLLREKEKGHWNALSKEEKKMLYRASFRQTFAEFTRHGAYPDTEYLGSVGLSMVVIAVSLFYYAFLKAFFLPPLPTTMTPEGWENTVTKMIQLQWNPITGMASKWDYENDRWRPGFKPWFLDYLPKNSPLRELTPEEGS
ncbi:cytochrome c oxidase subunit 4 isoform 1, mitochondrial-like isoform X1 [Diaphorina citri]|uniref:Cytochrome c oxidase subunit 4 n=1 Tax=Diaphorina citri TaxID=121845 RepID=A0A1S3CUR7_DIACI|nr:cytochrome c oxidase subunit 4 isoform 1, mitochondrial-like isoform X1 [Diaphorina citri]